MPAQKKIQRFSPDNYEDIVKTARINAEAFRELQETNNYEAVKFYRKKSEKIFQSFDTDWIRLVGDDQNELTLWAARMRLVRDQLDQLDRSCAFSGKRQFNWDEVLAAMGMLDAVRVATEQTLALNGVR